MFEFKLQGAFRQNKQFQVFEKVRQEKIENEYGVDEMYKILRICVFCDNKMYLIISGNKFILLCSTLLMLFLLLAYNYNMRILRTLENCFLI